VQQDVDVVPQTSSPGQDLCMTNEPKDLFLALVAHEMRNPLSAVSSGIKVLEQRLPPAEHGDVLQMMNRQIEYLARLVSDLLDVSRVHQGQLLVSKTLIRMSDVVDSALEICRSAVERKGHALKVLLPEQPVVLNGDKQRLSQVLVNLIDNAAKYTPDGGEIVLSVCQEGAQVLLAVQDDGIGISAVEAPHIFEVFKQIKQKDGSHKDGLGVGLYLVKMLVEAHGGAIQAHSDGAGNGSTFLVRLPCMMPESTSSTS
jgi:signal transduction histidine kinase